METNLMRRVYINGKKDLPKDNDSCVCHFKDYSPIGEVILSNPNLWPKNTFDWYLSPVPRSEIIEEMKKMNPYPESVFIPVSDEKLESVAKILKDLNFSPDAIFGHWGREVWNNCVEKIADEIIGGK